MFGSLIIVHFSQFSFSYFLMPIDPLASGCSQRCESRRSYKSCFLMWRLGQPYAGWPWRMTGQTHLCCAGRAPRCSWESQHLWDHSRVICRLWWMNWISSFMRVFSWCCITCQTRCQASVFQSVTNNFHSDMASCYWLDSWCAIKDIRFWHPYLTTIFSDLHIGSVADFVLSCSE